MAGRTAQIVEDRIVGDRRQVHLAFSGAAFPNQGEMGRLSARVLLGDRAQTELRIDSVGIDSPPDRIYTITSDHGQFTALGICEIDGDRLIEFEGGMKLGQVRPHPVRGRAEVEVETSESGMVELRLYDVMGIEQRRVYSGDLSAGAYRIVLDGSGLAAGVYICELRSGGHSLRQTILIAE